MKKKILLAVLAVVMLSFVGCNRNENPVCCEEQQGIITGRLNLGSACPPDSGCIALAVWRVVNDKGTFVLRWNENSIGNLEGLSHGDKVSICGTYVCWEDSAYDYFHLTVSRVIR